MEYEKKKTLRVLRHAISAPFIYLVIVPLLLLDIIIELYHHICFPMYGLLMVKRSSYIRIDRHKLKYLSIGQKINCAYCGYANGLAQYTTEIAGRTEKYWCGIMHKASKKEFHAPKHHKDFMKYGDEEAFRKRLER